MRVTSIFALLSTLSLAQAFSPVATPAGQSTTTTTLNAHPSRSQFIQSITGSIAATTIAPLIANADDKVVQLPSGTSYVIIKSGDGPQPKVGELAAIRFRAEVKQTGNKIDDIFDTSEPYYTRVGSGGLLKVSELVMSIR